MRKPTTPLEENSAAPGEYKPVLDSSLPPRYRVQDPPETPGSIRQLPHRASWQKELIKSRGEEEAAQLIRKTHIRFNDHLRSLPHFYNRALRYHIESSILPGLALYQTLLEDTGDDVKAMAEWKRLFKVRLSRSSKYRLMRLLRFLPDPFRLFRWATRRTMLQQFPPSGWEIEWIEDSSQCLAFDIYDCFYLKVLTSLGARELTECFCQLDNVLFATLPPSITWERTKTLASGKDCCDFRWCRSAEETMMN